MAEHDTKSRARRLETLNLVSFTHKDPDGRTDLESVGRTIDLSEGGIRFETETPIVITLSLKGGGESTFRDAKLVWAERKPEGTMTYGFEFIPIKK